MWLRDEATFKPGDFRLTHPFTEECSERLLGKTMVSTMVANKTPK